MQLKSAWRKITWSLRHRGALGTVRFAVHTLRRTNTDTAVHRHPFDLLHGTDTGGVIGGGGLATGSPNDRHIIAYAGIAPSRLRGALERWRASLAEDERVEQFSFVDLGCGKGRALLLASEEPFARIVGVELNPELAALAKANLTLVEKTGLRADLEVRCEDATLVTYPPGPLLLFLYNPFGPPVIRAVLDVLEAHVRASGARVDLLFQNESGATPLRNDPRLSLLWRGSVTMSAEDAEADPVASPEDITGLYRWRAE